MSEKVVLPKFDLPSEGMHPATKATLAVGGLLLIAIVVLGLAVWKRHAAQLAAEAQREAIIAERTAEANATIEAAKARAAEAAARQATAEADAKAKVAAAAAAAAAHRAGGKIALASASAGGRHHGGHRHGKAGAARAGAKGAVAAKGADDKKAAPKSTRNNDAIDKLLASFK